MTPEEKRAKRFERARRREERAKEIDRDKILRCPFCKVTIGEIRDIEAPFGSTLEGGACACGACFVHDRTGKLLGEAYMDALAMAYDWDYDAALAGEGGYEEAVIRFDSRFCRYFLGDGGPMDRSAKYYFIKRGGVDKV